MKHARFIADGAAPLQAASPDGARWRSGGRELAGGELRFAPACDGAVYGVALNDRAAQEAMAEAFAQPPYRQPPQAPVLYLKPRNTLLGHDATAHLPRDAETVEIGATLGLVFGETATRLDEASAMAAVAGLVPVIDLSLPHASLHRPPIREKSFDGACPIGPWVVDRADDADPQALEIVTRINGAVVHRRRLDRLVRPLGRLIADVTEFMTLRPGDVLLVGTPHDAPRARGGDMATVEIEGMGALSVHIAEAQA